MRLRYVSETEATQALAFLAATCGVLSAVFFGVVFWIALLAVAG